MKLLLEEVNYGDGFSDENDIFARKKLGLQLQNIILNSEDDSLVLAIDDNWGNGKTTFLKMWENELITNDVAEVIYFDAFKNDYQEDAFLALSSAIYPRIAKEDDKQQYLEAAKNVGKFIVKAGVKIGLRAATLGVVKDTDFEGIEDATSNAIEDPIEQLIEDKLKGAEKEEEIIQHFKNTISTLAADKKIIFIIDELDRARPDFSLDLLEKMKHVFNTKNLFFVLAVNKDQYLHIINKRYGNIDSETYLGKFIHFWFALPRLKQESGDDITTYTFMTYLHNKMKVDKKFGGSLKILILLLKKNNTSLRDCERCYSLLILITASNPPSEFEDLHAMAILTFLKVKQPKTFNNLMAGIATADEILKSINWMNLESKHDRDIKGLILAELLSDEDLIKAMQRGDFIAHERNSGKPSRALRRILPYFESVIL